MQHEPEPAGLSRFIRRWLWRAEVGPATIAASVEIRDLSEGAPETPPAPARNPLDPRA